MREAVESRQLSILLAVRLYELLRFRIVGAFGEVCRGNDVLALRAGRPDHRLVSKVLCPEQRNLAFQPEIGVLLHEAGGVSTQLHDENGIDVHAAELADIGAEVSSIQRIPELVDDRAT